MIRTSIPRRTLWTGADLQSAEIIDQTLLPHEVRIVRLATLEDAARSIKTMQVRGAPLIGVTAAFGVWLAMRRDASDAALERAVADLARQRPTAVNLAWALGEMRRCLAPLPPAERPGRALTEAQRMAEEDVETCRRIGVAGLPLIQEIAARRPKGARVNVLTHCNAGRLACIEWGTATAPVYMAHDLGLPIHVWVSETRPRNQGAALTAFELGAHGVPHTVIADNAGGHLMQRGEVDLCIVGADRVAGNGDTANKIGTYLKALAAKDQGVPFYVALPHATIDFAVTHGGEIPIEERDSAEVLSLAGRRGDGAVAEVAIAAPGSPAANPAFDVTPARFVTGFITDRGICAASKAGLATLFPEQAAAHRA